LEQTLGGELRLGKQEKWLALPAAGWGAFS